MAKFLPGGLSARLLVLTTGFVMLAEVLIYLPSAARFRETYFEARLEAAYLATRAVLAAPDEMVTQDMADELLADVGVRAIVLKRRDRRTLMLSDDMPPDVASTFDLMERRPLDMIRDALMVLLKPGERYIRVIGAPPSHPTDEITIILPEAPLRAALRDFSWRILGLSLVISLVTAGLVYFSLQWLMVAPMRRLTASMMAFRAAPEDASRAIHPSGRPDEIGQAETELAEMQSQIRAALTQKTRLAALGIAVSKVSHDLRNILATAQIVSDRLAQSDDPDVRRLAPRLVGSLDRAIGLCADTLQYGRADEKPPTRTSFALAPLVDDVAFAAGLTGGGRVVLRYAGGDTIVDADRDQLFRILLNLLRNAVEAMPGGGEVRVDAVRHDDRVVIEVADNGPGLGAVAREHLFEPFRGGARAGGTGLGLAIAQELVRAHGGDIALVRTGPLGTTFRLDLPTGRA